MAVAAIGVLQCQTCDAMSKIVTLYGCGHHFCISCLESLHCDWTAGCEQPCQHCFKLNVPSRGGLKYLTINPGIPNIASLNLQPSLKDPKDNYPDDKFKPCKVWGQSPMTDKNLRQNIVQLGIQAVEKYEDYFQRAKYISDELERTKWGKWACIIRHSSMMGSKSIECYTYFDNDKIFFRVGECYFDVFKQARTQILF